MPIYLPKHMRSKAFTAPCIWQVLLLVVVVEVVVLLPLLLMYPCPFVHFSRFLPFIKSCEQGHFSKSCPSLYIFHSLHLCSMSHVTLFAVVLPVFFIPPHRFRASVNRRFCPAHPHPSFPYPEAPPSFSRLPQPSSSRLLRPSFWRQLLLVL